MDVDKKIMLAMPMAEDAKRIPPQFDIESQQTPTVAGDTMLDGCLQCLDYFHPMGPPDEGPSTNRQIIRRRIASVLLSILIMAWCRVPFDFTPFFWVIQYDYPYLRIFELIISHALLAAACYFHFRIASVRSPTVFFRLLFGSRHRMGVRGGQVAPVVDMQLRYFPGSFWIYVSMDLAVMGLEFFVIDNAVFRAAFALYMMFFRFLYLCF
jgi:hypothetical protein